MKERFTSMVLTSIYMSHQWKEKNGYNQLDNIIRAAEKGITNYSPSLKELSNKNFDRIVFLGSGPLFGIAKESHLKVQELTDGHVVGRSEERRVGKECRCGR